MFKKSNPMFLIIPGAKPPSPPRSLEGGIDVLMERMKRLNEEPQEEELSQEELQKRFEKVEHQSAECEYRKKMFI